MLQYKYSSIEDSSKGTKVVAGNMSEWFDISDIGKLQRLP